MVNESVLPRIHVLTTRLIDIRAYVLGKGGFFQGCDRGHYLICRFMKKVFFSGIKVIFWRLPEVLSGRDFPHKDAGSDRFACLYCSGLLQKLGGDIQ